MTAPMTDKADALIARRVTAALTATMAGTQGGVGE